ncbi:prostaglandin E synthase 3 [Copidosoma floridanum]|uniref:prostaglandin E synthase 3 n=1 Tax=Copidosoma floridanum TaxID=29053 RepID=UPI0006C9BB1B|nr:prostaglandin E synthase 3 [Copidosoma floridanum]
MTQDGQSIPPLVMWAQRINKLYITICLEDCKDPTIVTKADELYFKGISGTDKKIYEVTINLFKEIDPEKTEQCFEGRHIDLVLYKKESGPFWPRLPKEIGKFHWLKNDFNKWQDEEESDDEYGNGMGQSLEDMVRQMGDLGGKDNIKPNFDDIVLDEADGQDSDDGDMPDLE